MADPRAGAKSLKDYLKKYESDSTEKKKKRKKKAKPEAKSILVVDEDPVWQKPVNLEEDEDEDDAVEEKPLVDEDIEVKRMRRLEEIRARRAYNAIAEDGSGWVPLSPKHANINNTNSDISPPRRQRNRNDSPSLEPRSRPSVSDREDTDLSPPRQQKHAESSGLHSDLSSSRKRRVRNDTPSPERDDKASMKQNDDIPPPCKRRVRNDTPSPGREEKHPRKQTDDLSPPRKGSIRKDTPSPEPEDKPTSKRNDDLSPPRRKHYHSPSPELSMKPPDKVGPNADLSPPRRKKDRLGSPDSDLSPPRKSKEDLSLPRKTRKESPHPVKEQRKTGLISGRDIREEILKTKKDEFSRFKELDPVLSGKGAEPVFRDKVKGERISKEEYMKSKQKVEEKPKEIKLEWGKGLAQKREAEARLQELELEKNKPFARTRDDPDLDKMLKERVRWGDPMAHLVKKKQYEPNLPDLGNDEKMRESGFVVPQEIPSHSWIKRGLDAAPNRYGIRPGRHWDGVDRSNGYEKQLFQRTNEKRATEREAYLWSVSDM